MDLSDEQECACEGLAFADAHLAQGEASGVIHHDNHHAAYKHLPATGAPEKRKLVEQVPRGKDLPSVKANEMIIRGVTVTGRTFRPSDWAERLAGLLSTFDEDNRLGYSPCVRPTTVDGIKSVIVSKQLKEIDEHAYNFLLGFGRDNDLVIEDSDTPST